MKKKIAFVVQRYGMEINGGSELHCRQLAERLIANYDVTVLTSCAEDYVTWKNVYNPGEHTINGVQVIRFPVDKPRVYKKFEKLATKVFADLSNYDMALEWQKAQGPSCPGLLSHIAVHKAEYDAIIFMTYLYSPTYFGMHIAPERSIFIPTCHDEAPIYLSIFASEFHLPKYIMYNTEKEREFVQNKFKNTHIPNCLAGVGVDINVSATGVDLKARFGIQGDYVLYIGRIDAGKNCPEMIEFYRRWRNETGKDVKLVLAGKSNIDIPNDPNIITVGFVSDDEKNTLLKNSKAVLLHSVLESLSMSTLEAMYFGTPVLLNGNCDVLRSHIEISNGGYYYLDYAGFAHGLSSLLENEEASAEMGRNGQRYVAENYQWEAIIRKFDTAIEYVSSL